MLNHKRLLALATSVLAAGSTVFGVAPAKADGMPVMGTTVSPYVTDWSGVYVGGKLGGAWSEVEWVQNPNYFTLFNSTLIGTSSGFAPSGFASGIIGGANVQHGRWTFGAELSFAGTDLSETKPSPFFPTIDTYTTDLDWLATAEGRIGYAWKELLVFGKGGWAGGNATVTLTDNVAGITTSGDAFANGWTIGGGIECAHWPSVILGLEYSYTRLSFSEAPNCPACGTDTSIGDGPPSISGDIHINAVMARASYLFKPH